MSAPFFYIILKKNNCLLKQTERKKERKDIQMERGRRRKGEVKGVLVSEYTSVLLQLDER